MASDVVTPQDVSMASHGEFVANGSQDALPMLLEIRQVVKVVHVSADLFLTEFMAQWSNDIKPMLLELPRTIKPVPAVLLVCIFLALVCMRISRKPGKNRSCQKSRELELAPEVEANSQPPQQFTLMCGVKECNDSGRSTSSGASSASDQALDTAGRPYRVSDAVSLWNHSANKWSDDGIVLEVSQDTLKVELDGGLSRMIVPVHILQHMVRRRESARAPTHTEQPALASQDASKTLVHTYSAAPIASNEAIQPMQWQSVQATHTGQSVLASQEAPKTPVQIFSRGEPMISCELVDAEGQPYGLSDAVSVWDQGANKWLDDGVVVEMSQDSVKVEFDGGSSSLIVPVYLQHTIRRRKPALAPSHTERFVPATQEVSKIPLYTRSGVPIASYEAIQPMQGQSVQATHTGQFVLASPRCPPEARKTPVQTYRCSPTRTVLSARASQEAPKTPRRYPAASITSHKCAPSPVQHASTLPTIVKGKIIGDWLQVDLNKNQALAPAYSPRPQTTLHILPPQRQQAMWQQATPRDAFSPRLR